MNIQDYYRKTASASLNASLASLIPPFFFIIYGIIATPEGKMVYLIIPFLAYSFFCYQIYLINDIRTKEIFNEWNGAEKQTTLFEEEQVLLKFLPAPTLRMLIFEAGGQVIGEIRDLRFSSYRWFMPYFFEGLMRKRYGLYDGKNRLNGSFILKKNEIIITDANFEVISQVFIKRSNSRSQMIFQNERKKMTVKQSFLFMDYQFVNQKSNVEARLRKGLIPLEWGSRFKDPNTPVLSFDKVLSVDERLFIYAILMKLFRCSNH
ncbi:hypothetical protein F7731_00800 [Cytobacillus depressus]|uniref:Uncharacterized protein n=1 Tax=Cytobacillus depressus TaxID=1602942 RepID=A0A6L3VAE6_9BACI|nr:hypothetical protein [Cytobacillus depressus]KAB2338142.1 hypothetical protein F7731_00800 [Cytobacillus depressus]